MINIKNVLFFKMLVDLMLVRVREEQQGTEPGIKHVGLVKVFQHGFNALQPDLQHPCY